MSRRAAAVALILAAAIPAVYGARLLSEDMIRGSAILAVSAVGVGAALSAAVRSGVAVTAWLKLMGVGLSIVILCATLGLWYYLDQISAPRLEQNLMSDRAFAPYDLAEIRGKTEAFRALAERLLWLSGAVVICGSSVALLPTARAASTNTGRDAADRESSP